MTLPRYRALQKYWVQHPRVEWLVAAYLKYKPPASMDAEKTSSSAEDMLNFFGIPDVRGTTIVG